MLLDKLDKAVSQCITTTDVLSLFIVKVGLIIWLWIVWRCDPLMSTSHDISENIAMMGFKFRLGVGGSYENLPVEWIHEGFLVTD